MARGCHRAGAITNYENAAHPINLRRSPQRAKSISSNRSSDPELNIPQQKILRTRIGHVRDWGDIRRAAAEHSTTDTVGTFNSNWRIIMTAYLRLALAGALLVASPALAQQGAPPGGASKPSPELTDAQAFSVAAGKIVGAAALCDTISKDRVAAATEKAASITSSVAADDNERASAEQLFTDAADVGKAAVRTGNANCHNVELSLAKLEQMDVQ
jgi:hypothetical protein